MEEEQKELYTCDVCGIYKGDRRQLNMHKLHCKPQDAVAEKQEVPQEEPKPETPQRINRKERISFGAPRKRLNAPDIPGYNLRVFNHNWRKEPGRVQRALDAGYEVVEGFESITVGTNEDGSEIKGILMKIPKEYYDQDQKIKQQEVDKVDEAIKKGTFEQQPGDKRYIPDGIKIWSSNNENK